MWLLHVSLFCYRNNFSSMNLRITSIRSDIIHLVVINKCNIKKCLVFVLSSRFGGGGNRKKSKEKSLLYLYGWMELKSWLVCISRAWPVAFNNLTPPPFNKKETETNTWSYYPERFLSKGQALSTTCHLCLHAWLTPGCHYFLWFPYVHPMIPGIQKEISRASHNLLSGSQVL